MISVIVPVYKVENYLRKCVASIQQQTYQEIEIILVDDGSPDNCGKFCDEMAKSDPRIKVIHQSNGGLSAARNSGLEYVLSEQKRDAEHYVAFVDGDDTIEPETYRTMIGTVDTGCDFIIFGHRCVIEKDVLAEPKIQATRTLSIEELWQEVFENLNNAAWNKLYKLELIGSLRFPLGIIHGEDLIFNLHYLERCKDGAINPTPFYNYLQRSGSITKSDFNDNKFYEIVAKDMAKEIIVKSYPALTTCAEKYCFRSRMNIIRSIYAAGKDREYTKRIQDMEEYVKNHFALVKKQLSGKEIVEYQLLNFKSLYRLITRQLYGAKQDE